jgi:hypothetical protein
VGTSPGGNDEGIVAVVETVRGNHKDTQDGQKENDHLGRLTHKDKQDEKDTQDGQKENDHLGRLTHKDKQDEKDTQDGGSNWFSDHCTFGADYGIQSTPSL